MDEGRAPEDFQAAVYRYDKYRGKSHVDLVQQFHDKQGAWSMKELGIIGPEGPNSLLSHLRAMSDVMRSEVIRVQSVMTTIDAGRLAVKDGETVPQIVKALRIRLIVEEVAEFIEALVQGDMVEVADALADIDYVVTGTAIAFGIPHDEVFVEVHAANMTKQPLGPDKKGGKTEKLGYVRPDIEGAIYRGLNRMDNPNPPEGS